MAPEARRIAAAMPDEPGIYMMKDAGGRIIYIGKAKSLRRRVGSYFARGQNLKTQRLVESIADIEFVLTDNESEAFLLESQMIKRHRPMFNIELKDQQRYTYLRVSDERYPRLLVARRTRDGGFVGGGRTYGPFTHGSSKLLTVGTLRKAFQIRVCKTLPKKVCLEYHLGNCEGPCEFEGARERYQGHVEALEGVLRGRGSDRDRAEEFTGRLEREMRQAAEREQFERAMDIRDTLDRLGGLRTGQKMEYVGSSDEEYFGISSAGGAAGAGETATVMNFRMLNGVIRDSDRFSFDLVGDNSFSNFLYQYYTTHRIPRLVLVSEAPPDRGLLESLLSERAGFRVRMSVPARGKRREIMDLIMKNVRTIRLKGGSPGLADLRDELGLPATPNVIECFDVSNHGEEFAVGAMSRFVGGMPDKSGYRRFRIRTVAGRDDFAMIGEITQRRYRRLLSEAEGGKKKKKKGKGGGRGPPAGLPDLVVVDGGRGQLNAAIRSLRSLGASIPCVGLAKENEEVHVPGRKDAVMLPRQGQALKILQHARDEAHRFGVAYNRAIRRKAIKQ